MITVGKGGLLLHSINALGKVPLPLLLPQCLSAELKLSQRSPDSPSLLFSQVCRLELLFRVELAKVFSLGLIDDCKNASD